MKLGLSSRVPKHASDHVNLSNQLKVRPGGAPRNYAEGLAAEAGEDSGKGCWTMSIRM